MKPQKAPWRSFLFFAGWIIAFLLGMRQVMAVTRAPKEVINYIVIGAFKYERNAERFVEFAKNEELSAQYEFNSSKRLFYVYTFSSTDRSEVTRELYRTRKKYPQYQDAWLFEGELGGVQDTPAADQDKVTPGRGSVTAQNDQNEQRQDDVEEIELDVQPVEASPKTAKPVIRNFYFNTFNVRTGREVDGKVTVIDPVRAIKVKEVPTHEIVGISEPNNRSNTIKFSANIFGYKEVQHMISLNSPLTDSTEAYVEAMGDSVIVDFQLERFKKGDVLVMYNVYFFRDASIMRSESLYELKSLLNMLSENESYKVTIHGHTNGNAPGKIIHLDENDKEFFTLNADHKEGIGSAKRLSFHRANTIKQWLIDQGIAEDRMKTKGWGGKKMIYDKHGSQAVKNVRVEIEITAD